MNEQRKYKWKRILRMTLWSAAGIALFVLLLSAMHRNNKLVCSGIEILIEGYNNEMFISEAEVKKMLEDELQHKIEGSAVEQINLRQLEKSLQKNPWISKAQIFVDNQQQLHVSIAERMPVARVFTRGGKSFYMDSASVVLPLSVNEIADVPVFTNVPDGDAKMTKADSLLWKQVSKMGNFIRKDSLLLMQLGQIDLVENAAYIMYPAIGNHTVLFGTADAYEEKLKRLSVFYRKIFGKVGLNKYEIIDLRYDKQIVATLRGKQEGVIDTEAAMKKFEELVNKTVAEANDTTYKIGSDRNEKFRQEVLASTSLQPTDGIETINDVKTENVTIDEPIVSKQVAPKQQPQKPTTVKPVTKQNKPTVITQKQKPMVQQQTNKPLKPTVTKPKPITPDNKQPKAVMPKKNDYK